MRKRAHAQTARADRRQGDFKCIVSRDALIGAVERCERGVAGVNADCERLRAKLDSVTVGGSLEDEIGVCGNTLAGSGGRRPQ